MMSTGLDAVIFEGPGRIWKAQSWLRTETLESLAELNEQCLELLCDQARARHMQIVHPLMLELRELWLSLDKEARRRAATCPYLLVDAGFLEARRWAWARGYHVRERNRSLHGHFFTVKKTVSVARLVFAYSWHLARSQYAAARLLLGMSAQCAELIGSCTLRQITELAERHPEWLQPRWSGRISVWRELLIACSANDTTALERVRVRGLQLLAADSRAGTTSQLHRYVKP
jgi:hypothetical protein